MSCEAGLRFFIILTNYSYVIYKESATAITNFWHLFIYKLNDSIIHIFVFQNDIKHWVFN